MTATRKIKRTPVPRCPTCGDEVTPPAVRCCCDKPWCGHKTKDHDSQLNCRICKQQCGLDCTRSYYR